MSAKAISFTPEALTAKLRALEEYGLCQTRRPVAVPRTGYAGADLSKAWADPTSPFGSCLKVPCEGDTVQRLYPPHQKGDLLWVRERALVLKVLLLGGGGSKVLLRYDDGEKSTWLAYPARLKPPTEGRCIPNGVFRDGARHFLEVVEVRAERVADISEHGAILEGIDAGSADWAPTSYMALYDSIYGAGAHAKDWCWAYTLKRAEP